MLPMMMRRRLKMLTARDTSFQMALPGRLLRRGRRRLCLEKSLKYSELVKIYIFEQTCLYFLLLHNQLFLNLQRITKENVGKNAPRLVLQKTQSLFARKNVLQGASKVRKTTVAWQHCYPEFFCKNPESFCDKVYICSKQSGWQGNYPNGQETVRIIHRLSG